MSENQTDHADIPHLLSLDGRGQGEGENVISLRRIYFGLTADTLILFIALARS